MRRHWLAKICLLFSLCGASAPKAVAAPPRVEVITTHPTTIAQRSSDKRQRAIQRRARIPKKQTSATGFLAFILPALVFVASLFTAFLHRRRRLETTAQSITAPLKKRHVHFAKPRNLKKDGGPDPATMTDDDFCTGAIIPIAGFNTESDLQSQTQHHVALGQTLHEDDLTSAGLSLKDAEPPPLAQNPDAGTLRLPPELAPLFKGLEHEQLLHHARFSSWGEVDGMLAVTNRRVLVAYRQTLTTIFPPFVVAREKRHKLSLSEIKEVRPGSSHRVPILWPGLVLCWWYPIGTLVAMVGLVVYFVLPREVMEIVCGPVVRKYPIVAGQLDGVMQTVGRMASKRRSQKQALAKARKQAS